VDPRAASSVSATVVAAVRAGVDADTPRLTDIFTDIHAHPELGFGETRTAAIVARELVSLGFDVTTGVGGTGVVGILRNGPGPTVMYRADMDANAVEEAPGLPYRSTMRVVRADGVEVPVAHMCGHDAHVTWMLGMAKAMLDARTDWHGTLVIVAQPAEELIAGARAMVEDGLYSTYGVPVPHYLVALHTDAKPTGTISSGGGVRMAGTDQLDVTVRGRGGHGAAPHLATDPVVMAAMAVLQYQTVVSRRVDPMQTAVLTVGAFQAGTDNNVIPGQALLKVNIRWFDTGIRETLLDGIRDINAGIARAHGLPESMIPTIAMKGGASALVNDDALIDRLNVPLRTLLGSEAVVTEFPAVTGSEDCHLLKGEHSDIPLAYIFVGTADPERCAEARREGKDEPFSAHGPDYVVDPNAIPIGVMIASVAVLELLSSASQPPA